MPGGSDIIRVIRAIRGSTCLGKFRTNLTTRSAQRGDVVRQHEDGAASSHTRSEAGGWSRRRRRGISHAASGIDQIPGRFARSRVSRERSRRIWPKTSKRIGTGDNRDGLTRTHEQPRAAGVDDRPDFTAIAGAVNWFSPAGNQWALIRHQ